LHLSVAAGIRTDSICRWVGTDRVVRCMPNTPALVGQGITGLFPCPSVTPADKALVEQVIGTTGQYLWVQQESHLDAVTALSGSGPAYVFYFLEAMTEAGVGMGLSPEQAYQLAVATFSGAASLAAASTESPEVLRQRVTSKGGTTYAAITAIEAAGIKASFVNAMQAAEQGPSGHAIRKHHAHKHAEPEPMVQAEGLETALAFTVAYQKIVPDHLGG